MIISLGEDHNSRIGINLDDTNVRLRSDGESVSSNF